jgi:hypothetical protein
LTEGLQTNPAAGAVLADTRNIFSGMRREIISTAEIAVIISASQGLTVAVQWYRAPDANNPGADQVMREQVIPVVFALVTLKLPGDLLLLGRLRVVTPEDVVDGSAAQASILVKT